MKFQNRTGAYAFIALRYLLIELYTIWRHAVNMLQGECTIVSSASQTNLAIMLRHEV
jgi:hypothetical protein